MLIQRRYRHLNRYRMVANTLAKHGFGYVINILGLSEVLSFRPNNEATNQTLSTAERLVKVLEDLGPTFVKFGQILSTRMDLLPIEYIRELEQLQDNVPPLEKKEVRKVIESELGKKIEEIFPDFGWVPLASASIGQVHKTKLINGHEVVVKVQRPNIKELMEIDLEIIFDLATFLDKKTSWAKQYGILDIVEELSTSLRGEIDYLLEGRNGDRFRENFVKADNIIFPKVVWEYSTSKILVLDYVSSIKISNKNELHAKGIDLNETAANFINAMVTQIFIHGFFHADPHPGNVGVKENSIVFMDYGQVGKIDEWSKAKYIQLIMQMMQQDVSGIVNILLDFGVVGEQIDRKRLEQDISKLKQKYYRLSFKEIKVGKALKEMVAIIQKYNIRIPADFALMIKALLTAEGIVQQLNPSINIMEIAEPLGKKLFKENFNIYTLKDKILTTSIENVQLLTKLPKLLTELLQQIEYGQLKVKVEHHNLSKLILLFNIASNRLALSIVLA
ncbi:MAG: AarF/ABC1/UbiB kinase family protein, partial [Bacillota bacterium]|nr:AarF/ABC1/UbiB kinase family protein [Bacillota bacterium]